MKHAEIAVALLSLTSGLIGAWYWLRSSRVVPVPLWAKLGLPEPGTREASDLDWSEGLAMTLNEASRLNAIAARWTAASVVLGTLTTLAGVWPI